MAEPITIEIKGECPISRSRITAVKILAQKPFIKLGKANDKTPDAVLVTCDGEVICFLANEVNGRILYTTSHHAVPGCWDYWLNRDLSDDAWELIIQLSLKARNEMLRQKNALSNNLSPINIETVVAQIDVRGNDRQTRRTSKVESLLYS